MKLTEYIFSRKVVIDYNPENQQGMSPAEQEAYEEDHRMTNSAWQPFAEDEEDTLGEIYVSCLKKYLEKHPNREEMERTLEMDFSEEEIDAYVKRYELANNEDKPFLERFHGWDATFILLVPWCVAFQEKVFYHRSNTFIYQVNVEINNHYFWYERLLLAEMFWKSGIFPKYEVRDGVGIIPEGTTRIVDYAFSNCRGLLTLDIPDSVTSVGTSAFRNCEDLRSITFPPAIDLGYSCDFSNCKSLKTIVLPESLKLVNFFSFSGIEHIEIPAGVTYIRDNAFEGCEHLKSVVIKCPVDRIEKNTFLNCTALETVEFPVGIKKIDKDAFAGCTALKVIKVPAKKGDYYRNRLPEELAALVFDPVSAGTAPKKKKPSKPKSHLEELLKEVIVRYPDSEVELFNASKLDSQTLHAFVEDMKAELGNGEAFEIKYNTKTLEEWGRETNLFQEICYWAFFIHNGYAWDKNGWPETYVDWADYEIRFPSLGASYVYRIDIDTL